jgi:RNA polymerase sigma-70 factor (ECF subfamily)
MRLIRRHDRCAFNELYDRYAHKLLHYFIRMLGGDEQKAQDFLQELCLKIVQKVARFNPNEVFSTWIYTIAHNMCKNEYRRLKNKKEFSHFDVGYDESLFGDDEQFITEQRIDQQIITAAIYNEVSKLDYLRRSTFLLRYQAQLPIKDISKILNCTEGTVKSRIYYITKHIAFKLKYLNPYNIEVEFNEKC